MLVLNLYAKNINSITNVLVLSTPHICATWDNNCKANYESVSRIICGWQQNDLLPFLN